MEEVRQGAVYARILRAFSRGTGVHLSAEEVSAVAFDEAIMMAAIGGDGSGEFSYPDWLNGAERKRYEEDPEAGHVFRMYQS